MKYLFTLFTLLFLVTSIYAQNKRPFTKHEVFLKGSEYELHVYRIYGRQDGNTMLIIGGIQGDEPGGYLSADLYSDLKIEKGNLIVVPRANFKSIILFDRGPDGDMNRQFPKGKVESKMDQVVRILQNLISEADVFLHLHEGWGFHSPKYIDKNRNPERFGQSIITDSDSFKCSSGKILDLKKVANDVLNSVNSKIENKNYHLVYFNTNTNDPNTNFKDMRKTATFYALTKYCIPSFGIESSKNLSSMEFKILIHNYAINEFMKIFGIIPENPQIVMLTPQFNYTVVKVNSNPKVFNKDSIIQINSGDTIEVSEIEANYKRGLSADVLGFGELNDINKPFKITDNTVIIFRKDNIKIAEIPINVVGQKSINRVSHESKLKFNLSLNNVKMEVGDNQIIEVKMGDILEFYDVSFNSKPAKDMEVNFKGFVPPNLFNKGDDRGYKIPIDKNLMRSYSKDCKGVFYPVVATKDENEKAKMWIKIK